MPRRRDDKPAHLVTGNVTEANYCQRATAYAEMRGACVTLLTRAQVKRRDGEILTGGPNFAELGAWDRYFEMKGWSIRRKWMKQWLDEEGFYCLPSTWPWDFDKTLTELDYGGMKPWAPKIRPREEDLPGSERRAVIGRVMKNFPRDPRAKPWEGAGAKPEPWRYDPAKASHTPLDQLMASPEQRTKMAQEEAAAHRLAAAKEEQDREEWTL